MSNIYGMGHKILSMSLSDLLIGADPQREKWVSAGASMIAVDTLVHNFLHRTGILRRRGGDHPYGPACLFAGWLRGDHFWIWPVALTLGPSILTFRLASPRFVQHAIWRFCAQSQRNICNGNRIDDRRGCQELFLPNLRSVRSRSPMADVADRSVLCL